MLKLTEIKDKNWYVIYTNPRAEKKVAERLEEEGLCCFLPIYKEVRQWSDRKKKVEVPLISSVVFLNSKEEDLVKLYEIHGVRGVLKEHGKFALVKPQEIENLKIIIREWQGEHITTANTPEFEEGDVVIVQKGPFKGLTGVSVLIKGKHRLLVKIETLDLNYTVDLPKSAVEKIKKQEIV